MIRRLLLCAVVAAVSAPAAPPLTTIQDILYKADGSRFTGTATISWSSFEAIDRSAIATQSMTVKIVDGNLRVQLVPTTSSAPAMRYTVRFNSDGRTEFEETWFVPSSLQPLRLRDVRVATPTDPMQRSVDNTITQSEVAGLATDLAARPVKGLSYTQGRVVYANAQGGLDSVSGLPGDCVRVDGSSGPCGPPPQQFIDSETPAGVVDGYNAVFNLSAAPNPSGSLSIYRNGILQKSGVDYTAAGSALTFVPASIPQPGDILVAGFRIGGGGATQTDALGLVTLCNVKGAQALGTEMGILGSCRIGEGLLRSGDRLDVRLEAEHTGGSSGFTIAVKWNEATWLERSGASGDELWSARADAGIAETSAIVNWQASGTASTVQAGVASVALEPGSGGVLMIAGKLTNIGDSLILRRLGVYRWR